MDSFISFLLFSSIGILFGTSILSVLYNFRSRNNILFSLYLFFSGLWLTSLYYSIPSSGISDENLLTLSARISYGSSSLIVFLIVVFFYYFIFNFNLLPLFASKKSKLFLKIFSYFLLTETILLCIFSYFTPYVYESISITSSTEFVDNFGILAPWLFIHYYFCYLLAIIVPAIKIKNTKGIARRKLLLIFIIYIITSFTSLGFNVILPLFGIVDYYLVGGIAYTPFSIVTLYIMAKYRFLGTQILFWSFIRIALAFLLSLVCTVFFHQYISVIFANKTFELTLETTISITIFSVFYLLFSKFIYYFKNSSVQHTAIKKLIDRLKFTINFDSFTKELEIAFTKSIGISQIEIFITNEQFQHGRLPFYQKNELTVLLENQRKVLVTEELEFSEIALTEEYYHSLVLLKILQSAICIPLFFRSDLVGFFSLGQKNSKEMFFKEEIDELLNLSDYLAVFLVNDALRNKDYIQTQELERTKEVAKKNEKARRLMHDMKNSVQSALAVVREIKSKTNIEKVWQIEESLWDMDDNLSLKDDKQVQKKILNVGDFFNGIVQSFVDLYEEKNITLSLLAKNISEDYLYVDRRMLRSIFENLLNNAYKFTPNEGMVSIEVLSEKEIYTIHH